MDFILYKLEVDKMVAIYAVLSSNKMDLSQLL